MANEALFKYHILAEAGAIFGTAITSTYIELKNYQSVDFIVATGIGTAADTTLKIKAKLGSSGTAAAISFKEKIGPTNYSYIASTGKTFSVGGTEGECGYIVVTVNADDLKGLYDRVAIDLTAVANSTVPGAIIAITYDPRYSE